MSKKGKIADQQENKMAEDQKTENVGPTEMKESELNEVSGGRRQVNLRCRAG